MAIDNEDFDSAKILKYEIDRLRSMAMQLDTDRVLLTPILRNRQPMHIDQPVDNYEDLRSIRPSQQED